MTQSLKNMALMTCLKSFLMVFNFTFWLSGILILAMGIWMMTGWDYIALNSEFSGMFMNASWLFIYTGAFIILIGSLACCCTLKGQSTLLYFYGFILSIIFMLEIGVGMAMFRYQEAIINGFDGALNQTLTNYAEGNLDAINKFDKAQSILHCCGKRSYLDWEQLDPPVVVPKSCCIDPDFCEPFDRDGIYTEGCFIVIGQFLNSNIGIVAGTILGIALFPLVGMFLSCCLGNIIKKAKYEVMA